MRLEQMAQMELMGPQALPVLKVLRGFKVLREQLELLALTVRMALMAPQVPRGQQTSPDSAFSVVMSFLPPVNPFVMLIRMASTSPPPLWQVWLSILVGVGSVFAALWFAAKVFRVGLLMYGKPPNFKTLIRWVRMA